MLTHRLARVVLLAGLLISATAGAQQAAAPAAAAKPIMVRAMGYHRNVDSGIWLWRGNQNKLRTVVHELLHRASKDVPRAARQELARLTGDRDFNEGLTSYFTSRALQTAGRTESYADPRPGASFGELRAWSKGLRTDAKAIIRREMGALVDTKKIMVGSDACFGRCYARDFGEPWVSHPGQPGVYGNSKSKVQQLVELVGAEPLRRAYLQGDVRGLVRALRAVPPAAHPSWLQLD